MLSKANKAEAEYIYSLLNSIEPSLYTAFKESISELKDDSILDEIYHLLETGNLDAALSKVQKSINNFATDVLSFYTIVGQATASKISELIGVTVKFDSTNYRAVRIMQAAKLRLIQGFTEDQRSAIRVTLSQGISQGLNPNSQLRNIKSTLGLNAKQVEAVDNYRRLLELNSSAALSRTLRDRRFDNTLENSIGSGIGLTNDQIERMVNRYASRQLDYRAKMIARTEALRAVHEANEEAFQQAIDSGDLDDNKLERKWVTAADERVRSSHSSMNGQIRGMNKPFISGNGYSLRYPGDYLAPASEVIHCRCVVITTIKED